ncbi:MAG: ATP synthase F0 subunit B [Candidatus Woykebacteria bacterium RIFCSPHIGHO2_01_FULL_43_29]|uniref:ATP synthase subunit b n=2 Tax=Candidatus Woykeibacteriota TaxID=1817899 RepID=A0A1G1WWZ0_9BACT|nr:MAG: ATP synthase F0 subunit B [Candidatus Woykebacteria bacterium RIFCSPHIGHO2_01_FULL_43_29]OGY29945.1 MAG: ATP synthase F0 subunit B [Candidatus Woykebacteria bacterium RIFCSPHIGHO2_02_FULL_43_16b]OGY32204.1 MAG: ATP synthase F0 subunit B [Candidatus Woykebacteria bacterium RIFCSPLOWO2_01_FULL_43_14]
MEILKEFGIKPELLLAQIINFLILLFILRKFLYAPILRVLKKRKDIIEKSLKDAQEIESRLNQISLEREEKLKQAGLEAAVILDIATKNSQQIIKVAHEKAQKDAARLAEKTQRALETEREKMFGELRAKVSQLVIMSFEKVASKIITEKDQKELIERSVKELN